jgi:2-methylisocitrate lyase-like PEP mutase family enzyme
LWSGLLPELRHRHRHEELLPVVRHRVRGGVRPAMQNMGRKFRQLLADEPFVFTGGVASPLDAQIAERVGMKSIYMSGYSVALAHGWPDMGFLTMTEVTRVASLMAAAVSIPIVADADDGYGNALSTMRTVEEFAKTGVAGIHLEDQRFPKRCGHIAGKTIVSREEALGKYRAAVDVRNRRDPEFVLIARTDAFGAVGGSLEEAIWRGRAYADAGVDLVWSEFSSADREPARCVRRIRGYRSRSTTLRRSGGARTPIRCSSAISASSDTNSFSSPCTRRTPPRTPSGTPWKTS